MNCSLWGKSRDHWEESIRRAGVCEEISFLVSQENEADSRGPERSEIAPREEGAPLGEPAFTKRSALLRPEEKPSHYNTTSRGLRA